MFVRVCFVVVCSGVDTLCLYGMFLFVFVCEWSFVFVGGVFNYALPCALFCVLGFACLVIFWY